MIHLHLFAGWLACTGTESSKVSLPSTDNRTEHIEGAEPVVADQLSADLPPDRNSPATNAILNAISVGEVKFTQFKGCHIPDTSDGDAPKGRFLYASNETDTVGLVLSIHHPPTHELSLGKITTLSLIERDVFIMIEIGERISTNFCVPDIKQIPIVTVLESHTGSVQIKRTQMGIEASIGPIVFLDQYTKREVSFEGVFIPAQEMVNPLVLE